MKSGDKKITCSPFKIVEKKWIGVLLGLCFLVYCSTYLGRLNYSASLAEIIRTEGFGKGQAGMIGTVFFASYGLGQLLSGFLGDRFPGKWMVFTGLAVSSLMNAGVGILTGAGTMAAVWCVNGLAQSLIWSPMIRILYEFLKTETRIRCCLYLNCSIPLGTMASYGLTALLIHSSGWRSAFLLPAGVLVLVAFIWLAGISRVEYYGKYSGEKEEIPGPGKSGEKDNLHPASERKSAETDIRSEDKTGKKGKEQDNGSWKVLLAASGLCWILVTLFMQGALKDGVTTWIPTYLEETHGLGTMAAILSSMVIPLCNLSGVMLASLLDRKIGRNEVATSGVFFGVCAISLAALMVWGGKNVVLALVMLAVSTTSMMAVNTMLIAVLPSRFGRLGKASSVSGILNSCVYAGGAVSTYGIGALSAAWGWNRTILLWIIGAAVSLLVCGAVFRRWKDYGNRVLT